MKSVLRWSVVILLASVIAYCLTPTHEPMATCRDGTVSYSKHRSGTCSRHGGVLQFTKDAK